MGIILAAELSKKYAMADESWREVCDFGLHTRFVDDFLAVGLPVNCQFRIEDMAEAMKKDKKAEGGIVHFVLPASVGDVRTVDMTVDEVIGLLA